MATIERRRGANTQDFVADALTYGLDFMEEYFPTAYSVVDSADAAITSFGEEVEADLNKGVEFVEQAGADAVSAAKEAGKEVFVDAPKAAWEGVKSGFHSTVDLAGEGLEWVWNEVEIPVLIVAGSAFMAFVGIPLIRAIRE